MQRRVCLPCIYTQQQGGETLGLGSFTAVFTYTVRVTPLRDTSVTEAPPTRRGEAGGIHVGLTQCLAPPASPPCPTTNHGGLTGYGGVPAEGCLFALPGGGAFVDEGVHAFFLVFGAEEHVEEAAFVGQPGL